MARGDGIWLAYSLDGTIMVPFGAEVPCLRYAVNNQLTYRRAEYGTNLLTAPAPAPPGSLAAATGTKGRKPSACSVCGLQGHRRGSEKCRGTGDLGQVTETTPGTTLGPAALLDHLALTEARASVELDRDQTHVVDGPVTVGEIAEDPHTFYPANAGPDGHRPHYCSLCGRDKSSPIHAFDRVEPTSGLNEFRDVVDTDDVERDQ